MRTLIKQILAMALMSVACVYSYAYDLEVDGIYYNIDAITRTAEVTNGENPYSMNTVIIPSQIKFFNNEIPVTGIGENAFENAQDVTTVELAESIQRIGSEAFRNCQNLTEINLHDSIDSIGYMAFYSCRNLNSVHIPINLKSISNNCFDGCEGLENIKFPPNLKLIGDMAFSGCIKLKSLYIPNSVDKIGSAAFADCDSISELIIEQGTEELKLSSGPLINYRYTGVFSDCYLQNVFIGRDLDFESNLSTSSKYNSDPPFAGRHYQEFKKLIIASTVDVIHSDLFYRCDADTLIIEDSNKPLDACLIYNYTSDKKLKPRTQFGSFTPKYVYLGRNVMPKRYADMMYLWTYIKGRNLKTYIIGNNVVDGSFDFYYPCVESPQELDSVYIGNGITKINDDCFKNAVKLKEIELGIDTKEIGKGAFIGCSSLEGINLKNVEKIDINAFNGCSSLKEIKLPETLNYIDDAFQNCNLDTITCVSTIPPTCKSFPNNMYLTTVVRVPFGTLQTYKNADIWKNFWNIIELPSDYNMGAINEIYDSSNWDDNKKIDIYNLNGYTIRNNSTISELKTLPSGFYIIKSGGKSLKVKI